MFSVATISTVVFCYLLLLFLVGFIGDKLLDRKKQHPLIYGLAMGVHCTSWAFFGTSTQATLYGWAFVPTYLGVIFVMLFGFTALKKIALICQQNNVSSLADFVGLQYRQSHMLAAIVTLLCFIGVVPYIALQLDSVTHNITLISAAAPDLSSDIGLYVTALLAILAILFGARTFDLIDKKPGLMLTVAFASLLKLVALLCVGLFVCYGLFDGIFDLMGQAQNSPNARQVIEADPAIWVFISHILLGICAMFCLPRQFHVNFVENKGEQELVTARWLFPLYLLGMTLFVLPIALAGQILLNPETISTDSYALALPLMAKQKIATLISFVGGLAAATSMVIVATLAVGIMISNNLITPIWIKFKLINQQQNDLTPGVILFIRRLAIASVLFIAYLYHRDVSSGSPLVNSGIISIALLSQIMPMIIFGLYWQKSNRLAALSGLIVGALCWFYWLLWPSITGSYYFDPMPTDLELGRGFMLSVFANTLCYVLVTLLIPNRKLTHSTADDTSEESPVRQVIKLNRLLALTQNVLNHHEQDELATFSQRHSRDGYASPLLLERVESILSGKIGGASARILISAISEKDQVSLPELFEWMEQATQTFQFNHEILQSSVQHIQQGISVIDPDLKLIAWNQRYVELFDYPDNFIKAGLSMQELLEFNAKRGLFGHSDDAQQEIAKRIEYIRQGSRYKYVRKQPGGQVIELNGSPLPGGGFVTTYSDITEYIEIQQQLEQAKTQLELRVAKRTEELKNSNQALTIAKHQAELANDSKTKFLAAAGHDLMQPFNAASLFGELINQKSSEPEIRLLSQSLKDSLNNAEELLSLLLDMTKLESGILVPHIQPFAITEILDPLANEFAMIAQQKGLEFHYVRSSLWIRSDKKLLRRVIQNLLSNAVRYTAKGRIVLGCKRNQHSLQIRVLDTGSGISVDEQQCIFEEFRQLNHTQQQQGLGLGLTIVDKISSLLKHPVKLLSEPGKGSQFSVAVNICQSKLAPANQPPTQELKTAILKGKTVLLVENDVQTRTAVKQLLTSWEATVVSIETIEQVADLKQPVDLMLLDYHLDDGLTGIEMSHAIRAHFNIKLPGILNSAERSEEMRSCSLDAGLLFLPKPLKSAALKRMLRQAKLTA
ncbi:PAS domain-containing hybrid sensor histidine kinase/response regulator [Aliiglaciecola sp. LCG003]|uniref:PAS domain-containing hybrid sensor histidine kinase/response regulator n=1 Tax=Aliiglaciecola sp. LCG003 TaxID=3053655 RepID=UPI00257446B8|nr:PAS domain-containing hybrid sensor histidine kinase/response regulator [Aliiglaciecola sp. LCG003]WJG08036.1 PAS domain-containing hybrid sensor histidine kinase/response regulator [Aliiglaciecola sp. LCG003]